MNPHSGTFLCGEFVLSRGEMQHLPVGLAGGFWRKGGSTASCPFPKLDKGGSLSKAGLVVIFLPGNPSPNGMGRQRGGNGQGRKVADQNPSRKTV